MNTNLTKHIALPIAAAALFAASVFSSCSKDIIDAPVEDMEYYRIIQNTD